MVMTPEARAEHIQAALDARDTSGETYPLTYRGERKVLPVVRVNVEAVVLNHRSHRIQAELESHEKAELVERDPESDEAQEIIAKMLRGTEQYDDLRDNLREEGQRDAGVITRSGLLVNANRRTTALRDIGERHVLVAVLPPNTTEEDIDHVEFNLQVAKDYFADYSFTNQLKFIHDWVTRYDLSTRQIAKRIGYVGTGSNKDLAKGQERVEQELRLLQLIREVQDLSDPRIPLTFFDTKRQMLLEIDERYQKMKTKNPKKAIRLRQTRLIGLFLEAGGYREMRKVREDFFDDYLLPAIQDDNDLKAVSKALTSSTPGAQDLGLDALGTGDGPIPDAQAQTGGRSDDGEVVDPTTLVRLLATSYGQETITLPRDEDGQLVEFSREYFLDTIASCVDSALSELEQDENREDKLTYPIDRAREAEHKLHRAKKSFEEVCDTPGFDLKKFQMHLEKTERAAKALSQEVKKKVQDRQKTEERKMTEG